ncbi:S-adenosyl-L-methionine:benzoic acid/salicylic acid carboxyl methyltransferase 1-like [Andrographis paniculata]|uniref:S-adenosyl-L-methionine:benzoic acid/salicylic acid carboxyl methyltransferase 1-like n=1 Tax=Andrographis paniculata TaxID=175694 RepID=UPI0021E91005|nr:S-adenosyl-L-methionine:benzoic acid/salicylic acid carboxyl methyltransferase 1-like [Andrographis paniculata]
MEVVQVLHMNGGSGDSSYANNSLVQRKVISMTKPITEAAITEAYTTTVFPGGDVMSIADLGCSCGPNTFFVAAELVRTVDNLCQKLGRRPPEFQISLNDLPGNDFNTVFQAMLPAFQEVFRPAVSGGTKCFVSGVPGSFYGRLFAAGSLHFVHSSYSLMWLSKVPEGVELNKVNIYIARATPRSVIDAYYKQFQVDFLTFLKCRSEEVVSRGKMVLTLLGRKGEDPSSKDGCYIWELLALALQKLVSKGRIEEQKLHSFHIPQYTPSPAEMAAAVAAEGSFAVDCLETTEITWASGCGDGAYDVAKCMRSVAESLLSEHFGKAVMDEVFDTYRQILSDRMAKEDPKFINVTISLTRK